MLLTLAFEPAAEARLHELERASGRSPAELVAIALGLLACWQQEYAAGRDLYQRDADERLVALGNLFAIEVQQV